MSVRTRIAVTTLTLATAGLVAACSGGSGSAASSTTPKPSASSSSAPSRAGRRGNGANGAFFGSAKVQACLKAAGITVPTARPSGSRPTRPSGSPTGSRRPRPTGTAGRRGGFGGFGGPDAAKIQAALKACGIAVPSRAPRSAHSSPSPTASPSSSS